MVVHRTKGGRQPGQRPDPVTNLRIPQGARAQFLQRQLWRGWSMAWRGALIEAQLARRWLCLWGHPDVPGQLHLNTPLENDDDESATMV